jgi:ribosomal protein L31E
LTTDEIAKLKVKVIPIKSVEEVKEKVATGEAGVPPEEEIPDFLEFSFGSEGGKIRGKGPKIILFKDIEGDSYINFLENLCLRVYREIEGGEPKAVKIEKIDDLNKREIERWLEAGGKIFTINLDEIKKVSREELDEVDETHLMERLEETYSSGLGFIIFTTRSKEKFEEARDLLERINLKSQGRLNMIFIEARSLPLDLIKLSSGMIDLHKPVVKMEVHGVPTLSTFDYVFNNALFKEDSCFNKVLEEIKNEENGLFKLATARNKGQEESDLHYNIKVFIVRYLVNKLRKEGRQLRTLEEIRKHIKTEEKSEEVIPDVQVNNEVYEVETLFGEGVNADKKIDETIKNHDGKKVNIVMDNFGFLLHLKDLERRKRHYNNVEFYTLDLKNKELVSIEEFKKELRKILSSTNNKADFLN